jgi:SAM-dependent methyltransferase
MIDLFSNLSAGRVLDVATGRGGFIHFLLEHLKDFVEITGIDTQESAAAAFADAFPQPNIHFSRMDAAHLDFPDSTFDTVCIANSLHHLPDVHAVLSEMQRVLKPGGHFICLEMYRDGQDEAQQTHVLMHHWWAAVDMARGVCHHPTFTRQELLDLLDSLQLERVQIIDHVDDEGDPFDPEGIAGVERHHRPLSGPGGGTARRDRTCRGRAKSCASGWRNAASRAPPAWCCWVGKPHNPFLAIILSPGARTSRSYLLTASQSQAHTA